MSKKPLVSVVIPTYKRPEKIKETINTVKNQSYQNIELIIVDDNNPNDEYRRRTREIVLNEKDIIYIEHDSNLGACAARNTGVKESNGKFVAFLDDDDEWVNTKIEKQVNLITKNKEVGLVLCNFKYNKSLKTTNFKFEEDIFVDLLKKGYGISTSTFLVDKDLLEEVNGFDLELPSHQDYDLLLKIALVSKLCLVEEILMIYNEETKGISDNHKSELVGREKIIEKYKKYYFEFHIEEHLFYQYEKASHYAIMCGMKDKAVTYLLRSLKYKIKIKNISKLIIICLGNRKLYYFILKLRLKLNQ